LPPPHGHFHS